MKLAQTVDTSKILGLIGLILLSIVVVTLHTVPPAAGYEISIYQAYPWYFWAALVGSIFVGQIIIVQSAVRDQTGDQFWIFGLGLLLVSNAVLVFFPYIRDYPVYGRADTLTHIGFIQDISIAGLGENIYPLIHLLTYTLSHATGLEATGVINLLSPVFTYVFFGGLFYMTVYAVETRRAVLFVLPFAVILTGQSSHVDIAPFEMSVLFVPFILYLLLKEQRTGALPIRVALVLSVIGLVIYHPLTTVFLLLSLIIYKTTTWIDFFGNSWAGQTTVTSLMTVVFAAWYLSFIGIIRRFEFVYESVFGSAGGESSMGSYTGTVDSYSPALTDLIQIALYRYGIEAILLTLAGLFVILAVYLLFRTQHNLNPFIQLFVGSFFLFTGFGAFFFATDLIVGYGRPLLFGNIFTVILAGLLFHYLWDTVDQSSRQTMVSVFFVTVLLALAVLTVVAMYPAPSTSETNHQVTAAEIDGAEWIFETGDQELLIDEIGIRQFRFSDLHYGTTNTTETIRREGTSPPRRFGYEENATLGASYDQDTYMVVSRLGEVSYPERFPQYQQHWRYTPEGFERLEYDHSVSRLYDNGEFKSYHITARDEQPLDSA